MTQMTIDTTMINSRSIAATPVRAPPQGGNPLAVLVWLEAVRYKNITTYSAWSGQNSILVTLGDASLVTGSGAT